MSLAIKIPIFLVILLSNYSAFSADINTHILLENNMQAIYVKPPDKVTASVLLIHGWAGQMNEVGDLYKHLAKLLEAQGIATLRINIRGESEREKSNYTLTSTFKSRVEDATNGLNYLRRKHPNTPLGMVGFSLGGSTAMALTGLYPQAIDSVVLWSTGGNPKSVATNLFTEQEQAQITQKGQILLSKWVDITVTKAHLEGFNHPDVIKPLSKYKGALLCIRGSNDYIPDIDREILNVASGETKESLHIIGADHIFNVLDTQKNYDERVLQHTVHWFTNTLQ